MDKRAKLVFMKRVRSMSNARDSSVPEHLHLHSAESGRVKSETEPSAASAGSLIRQAREAAGLDIATLAVLLKVPVKKLEALEADRFDLLPDAVFVRALASSVCRNLKIDTATVLQKLPQVGNSDLAHQSRGINTPFRGSDDRIGPSFWVQVSRPAVLAGLALLLSAVVLFFLPTLKAGMDTKNVDEMPRTVNAQPAMSSAIGMVSETVSAAISEAQPSGSSGLSSSVAVISSAPASGLASAAAPSVPPPASAALQTLSVPASPASAAPSVASTGIVVFTAKGASWIQVSDAKGGVVLRRTLVPGEIVGASGALPLTVVVGKADAMQVHIRGNAFDLSGVAKDNVARFEVK